MQRNLFYSLGLGSAIFPRKLLELDPALLHESPSRQKVTRHRTTHKGGDFLLELGRSIRSSLTSILPFVSFAISYRSLL